MKSLLFFILSFLVTNLSLQDNFQMFIWKTEVESCCLLIFLKKSIIAKEQIRIFQAALSVIMLLTVGNSLSVVGKVKIADGYFRPLCPECLCSTTKPAKVRVKPSSLLPWSLPVPCRSAVWQADRAAEAGRQRAPNPPSSHHQGWTLVSGLGCSTGACLFTRIFCLTRQPCDLLSKN